jgi:hypothetical protein
LLSYIYADLKRDDPRVTAAFDWLRGNYTLEENPGMGPSGYYYYLQMMSKALSVYGVNELQLQDGKTVDWRRQLVSKLLKLQQADGSWRNENERWMCWSHLIPSWRWKLPAADCRKFWVPGRTEGLFWQYASYRDRWPVRGMLVVWGRFGTIEHMAFRIHDSVVCGEIDNSEWFSVANGRVVVASADFYLTLSAPEWRMDVQEEAERATQAAAAMDNFMERLVQGGEERQRRKDNAE